MTDGADRRTRDAFDVVASDYARLLPDLRAEAPLDRAVLAAFVDMVQGDDDGVVADVGCGAGRVTAHLADAGLRMVGLDLSLGMVLEAHAVRADLPFAVAHAAAIPLRKGSVAGLVAWYSLINLEPARLPSVIAEFARVARSGAPLVVAFQSGDGRRVDRTSAYGHPVPITYYRHATADVADALVASGWGVEATLTRGPWQAYETTPQSFLIARRLAEP